MATKSQGDTLVLIPEDLTLQSNGAYKLYNGQLVVLCATLTRATQDIQDGEKIQFSQVAWPTEGIQTSELELIAYFQENDAPTGTSPVSGCYAVSVAVQRVGWGQGVARLCVWVGGDNTEAKDFEELPSVTAETADQKLSASFNFAVVTPTVVVPTVQSGVFLPQPKMNMVPSSGSFIYCQFTVLDGDTHAPLPNMRVRLSGEGKTIDAWWAGQVQLYPSYEGSQKLPWWEDFSLGWGADLITDEAGLAEVFLCPQQDTPALGGLTCTVGNASAQDPTGFVVADLKRAGATKPAPYTDYGAAPVQLGSESETFNICIPRYHGAQADDKVFVFCNGDYTGMVPELDLNAEPMAQSPADCRILRSVLYDQYQPKNTACYVVAQVREAFYSKPCAFYAEGPVPSAQPDHFDGHLVAAPSVVGNPYGLPVNYPMVAGGLRVRVPLSGLNVDIGDAIELYIYLNGWAQDPHEDQPRRAVIGAPWGWKITPKMLNEGYADWWFQARCFMGFGQSSDWDLGTFEAQYQIYEDSVDSAAVREKHSKMSSASLLYSSKTLILPLDTIPPAGYDEWGGDYAAGIQESFESQEACATNK